MTDSRSSEADHPAEPSGTFSARATGAPGGSEPRGEIASSRWRIALLVLGIVALGVYAGQGWLLVIGAIFVMVFLHELGHFVTAKWAGMKVTEFFIGIGPKLWSVRRGETEYGIKAIPFVAYVRIIGMNNLDECPPEDEPRTYRQQSYPKRLLVVSAGSIMHVLQAFVLFVVVFGVLGVDGGSRAAAELGGPPPDPDAWFVSEVTPGSAAADAGIRPGDDIVSIDGERVVRFTDIGPLIEDRIGDQVALVVDRDGEPLRLEATIGHREGDPEAALLGVGRGLPDLPNVTVGPLRAVTEAGSTTLSVLGRTVGFMGSFFTGGVGDFASDVFDGAPSNDGPVVGSSGSGGARVANPEDDANRVISMVGIAREGASSSQESMSEFLLLLALVNLSIGVLNMLPLLPLDGGHAAIATYERIRSIGGRRHMADVSRLLPLTYAVIILLIFFSGSAVYLDIVDPIDLG